MSATVISLNTARPRAETRLSSSAILGRSADGFLLADALSGPARRAVGCLVEPEVGDTVLLAHDGADTYILTVLARAQPTAAGTVILPGGSQLRDDAGSLSVQSDTLRLSGSRSLNLDSPELGVSAASAQLRIKHASAWLDSLDAYAVSIAMTTRRLTSRVGRLFLRAVESLRTVDRLDETRAGRIKVDVQGHHQTQAAHITARAQGLVKIDGQKIDLG